MMDQPLLTLLLVLELAIDQSIRKGLIKREGHHVKRTGKGCTLAALLPHLPGEERRRDKQYCILMMVSDALCCVFIKSSQRWPICGWLVQHVVANNPRGLSKMLCIPRVPIFQSESQKL
jgi:hypothetical protein